MSSCGRRDPLSGDLDLDSAGLEAALEALGAPAFILCGEAGDVHRASSAGRSLEREVGPALYERFRGLVRAGEGDEQWSVVPLRSTHPVRHFLVVARLRRPATIVRAASDAWGLTLRQRQVLALVVAGFSNKLIATSLECAIGTVELHVSALLRKSGTASRTELIVRLWSGALPAPREAAAEDGQSRWDGVLGPD